MLSDRKRLSSARVETEEMKKILFLNPVSELGGAEKVLLAWMEFLAKKNKEYELHLLLASEGKLATLARNLGVKTHIIPLPKSLQEFGDSGGIGLLRFLKLMWFFPFLRYLSQLKALIQTIQPTVIHSNGMKTHILSSLTLPKNTALIWHQHDFISIRPLLSKLLKILSRKVTYCICVSELVTEDAKKVSLQCKCVTTRNGINLDHFAPGPSVGDSRIRIGLIATYAHWKGHKVFIEAATKVLERHPHHPLDFYIVGGPIYQTKGSQFTREELVALVEKNRVTEYFTFVPFEENILPIYHALDCVVHASTRAEPFGLTIAEAMACGKTVIASLHTGALYRNFPENKKPVLLCEPNVDQLADNMTALIEDELLRNALKINARKYAEEFFDVKKMNESLSSIYEKIFEMSLSEISKKTVRLYTAVTAISFAEFFLIPFFLLSISLSIPAPLYHVQVEPLLPAVFFTITLALLIWKKNKDIQVRESLVRPLIIIHAVSAAVFFIYIHWLSSIFPFQPLDPESIWVKLAREINPLSGPFTFRYRIVIYLLFLISFISLFEAKFVVTRSLRCVYTLAVSAGILFGEYFFTRIVDHLFWKFMKGSVGILVYRVTNLFFPTCSTHYYDPDGLPIVGTCDFYVSIAAPCAGLEGIALFLLVLATVLWMDRGTYSKRSAFLFGALGVLTMYAFNILRIFVLILVGHYYDPEFAVGVWHAYSGIFFYAIAIFAIFKWGYTRMVKK